VNSLNVVAAASITHLWWRSATLAERWRD